MALTLLQLDLNDTGKALFQKAATELQAEKLVELAKCGPTSDALRWLT